ncbi:MAG: hypothetical protein ACRC6O_12245 [Flavobacterium sp.]
MEPSEIELLLENYFQGRTSTAEEKELMQYFASSNVAPHLARYQPLFGYFSLAKEQKSHHAFIEFPIKKETNTTAWWSVAAAIVCLFGFGLAYTMKEPKASVPGNELGSCETPEEALRATQKALTLLSGHVNTGIESVQLIQEYETSKRSVFNQ